MEPLHVALLNTADFAGGAESVARMLRDGLRAHGHGTDLWVGRRRRRDDDPEHTHQIPATTTQQRAAKRYADRGFFSLGVTASDVFCDSAALSEVDLIHLHNVHGHYFSITAVPHLARRAPLVWTFHDFFPITGGCAFPQTCERWLARCGSCPQQGTYPIGTAFDRTRRMQSIKRKVFRDLPATIITPSRHLGRAVRRSGIFSAAEFAVIPYGVDTDVFRPRRDEARRSLGLSLAGPVVGLVAQGLDDPRKGLHHAVTALHRIDLPDLVVLLAGMGDDRPIAGALAGHDVRCLGYVTDRETLARCYAAADLFLMPSLAENYPCVVQEAMACGTAVLAFDIDGVNEQIVSGRTGLLVPPGDTAALTDAARQLLREPSRMAAMGAAARRHAETEWPLDRFIERHVRLYREVVGARPTQSVSDTILTRSPKT